MPDGAVEGLLAEITKHNPDLVVVEGMFLADAAHALIDASLAVVLDMHNVESDLCQKIHQIKGGKLKQATAPLRYVRRLRRSRQEEQRLAEHAQAVWVCSDKDRQRLKVIAPNAAQVDIVPNPAPQVEPLAKSGPMTTPHYLFLGHLGYKPNILAALELIQKIFPQIRQSLPQAHLTIAGRMPHRTVLEAAQGQDGITLLDTPPCVAALYEAADIVLIPLRIGGGTPLKILEAMAYGLPVITTAIGAEGLEATPGTEFIQAETVDEIAHQASAIAKDAERYQGLQQQALDWVQGNHSALAMEQKIKNSITALALSRQEDKNKAFALQAV
ncbi:glycosyltransferase family 4 protein [Halovulum sp. GXIMD14793]